MTKGFMGGDTHLMDGGDLVINAASRDKTYDALRRLFYSPSSPNLLAEKLPRMHQIP